MYGYIYETTCLINGKKYIGQHKATKFSNKYVGSGKTFLKAVNKYGKENFKCTLLKECSSREELNAAEKFYIQLYDAVNSDNYYNISEGGEGHCCEPWNKGKHGVQEWTPKMEEAFEKGRHLHASDKLKAFLSSYRTGIQVSDDTRKKLSDAVKGRKWMTNGITESQIKPDEIQLYLDKGYKLGRLKTKRFND